MAVIVRLKNEKTGEEKTLYSVDARELMAADRSWVFKARLPRTQRKNEIGTEPRRAAVRPVETHALDAPTAGGPKVDHAPELAEVPAAAPDGGRGGGPREAPTTSA